MKRRDFLNSLLGIAAVPSICTAKLPKGTRSKMAKIGPLENVIGEKISGYEIIHVDRVNNVNGHIILKFESGKKLLWGSLCAKEDSGICHPIHFMGPVE